MTDQQRTNARVLKLARTLRKKYSELYRYMEETEMRIPPDMNQEAAQKSKKACYDAVDSILSNCIREFSGDSPIRKPRT